MQARCQRNVGLHVAARADGGDENLHKGTPLGFGLMAKEKTEPCELKWQMLGMPFGNCLKALIRLPVMGAACTP